MKTITDAMGEQLNALRIAKQENFGGIPDDYRQTNEEILSHNSASLFMMMQVLEANKEMAGFVESLEKSGIGEVLSEDQNEKFQSVLVKVDHSKKDDVKITSLIRKNWSLFQPVFMMFYIGMKVGRQMEREEQESLRSIARAERAKANPNAFDEVTSPKVMLAASSDSSAPALSPEKVDAFRRELEEDLKRMHDEKKD